MVRLTLFLLLLPLYAFAQPSWVNISVFTDQFAGETSWEIYQGDSIVAQSSLTYSSNSLHEELVFLNAGQYDFVIYDTFGDGICCGYGEGWFGLENPCGLDVYVYDFSGPDMTLSFDLFPCPPPIYGCLDENASNYNPEADISDNFCLYEITFQLDLNGPHPEEIDIPEVNSTANGWCGNCWAMSDEDGDGIWSITVDMAAGFYLWKFSADTWEVEELPVGVSQSACFQFDDFGFVNRTLLVDGPMVLPPFCWESCLPCGAVPGCMNENALNYNPWATVDVGCNTIESAECELGFTELSITIIPDNYPGETSWILSNDLTDEIIAITNPGYIGGAPLGIPVTTNVCAPSGVPLAFEVLDTYGDGLNGAQWGGEDGSVIIEGCEEVIYELPEEQVDFGYSLTYVFDSPFCQNIEDIVGCGNPDYLEYNPNATIQLDIFCSTPVVLGCMDNSYFNYDSLANVEEKIDSCFYTLTLTDGVGDGWFGSWLGVTQGDWLSPQYQMGPNDGNTESFDLYLSSNDDIGIYFFETPQSAFTTAQCGFMLEGPTGDTLINIPQWSVIPFPFTYSAEPYCGNTCEPFSYGCTDTTAYNYDVLANTSNGICYYNPGCTQAGYLEYYTQGYLADYDDDSCEVLAVFGCTDETAFNYSVEANVDNDGCIPVILGCTNPLAYNYDENANTNDGCIEYAYGCTDPTAFNYDPLANTDDGGCIDIILGCTDPEATNYNPLANTDNGGCIDVTEGCTDINAYNYDPLANTADNESCLYDAGCVGGPGNPYWANDECYMWVIDVDPYCCESEWDDTCVNLYTYCQDGTATYIPYFESEVKVFPNPVARTLTVRSSNPVTIEIYNSIGALVVPQTTNNQIDMSVMPVGMYQVVIRHDGRSIVKNISKQ